MRDAVPVARCPGTMTAWACVPTSYVATVRDDTAPTLDSLPRYHGPAPGHQRQPRAHAAAEVRNLLVLLMLRLTTRLAPAAIASRSRGHTPRSPRIFGSILLDFCGELWLVVLVGVVRSVLCADECLCRQQRTCNRCRVLERPRGDSARVAHARGKEVLIHKRLGVEAKSPLLALHLLQHHLPHLPRVVGHLTAWLRHGLEDDVHRKRLVAALLGVEIELLAAFVGVAQHVGKARTAPRHHALGDGALERIDRVLVP
mmetsp:Transcript_25107/g.63909  ORF Transcript_25107/g.63909 Transcript_25107/m.63909 type:complete len:257 (+) Transcript_25107:172-942(+)